MENSVIAKVFSQFGNTKPKKSGLFSKRKPRQQPDVLQELSELIISPLKANLKKDILTRANKLAEQISLDDAVYEIKEYFKKNKWELNSVFNFNSAFYNNLNKQSHCERVMFYCLFIAVREKLSVNDFMVLVDGAKLHDIGRNMPDTDLLHGQKSAGLIKFYNLVNYNDVKDYNALLAIVDAHSAYDKNIEGVLNKYDIELGEYDRVKQLCHILKDAEALDKVRFFNESAINTERMIKSNLLKTKTAKSMVSLAFELNEFYNSQK